MVEQQTFLCGAHGYVQHDRNMNIRRRIRPGPDGRFSNEWHIDFRSTLNVFRVKIIGTNLSTACDAVQGNVQSQWRQERKCRIWSWKYRLKCRVWGPSHRQTRLRSPSVRTSSSRLLSLPIEPRCTTTHANMHTAPHFERERGDKALSPLSATQHTNTRHPERYPTDVMSLVSLLGRSMLFKKRRHNGTSRGCSLLTPKPSIRMHSMVQAV